MLGSRSQHLFSTRNVYCGMSSVFKNQCKVHMPPFLNPESVFDISFNLYVIASVLGMNKIKMFVGIFLEYISEVSESK